MKKIFSLYACLLLVAIAFAQQPEFAEKRSVKEQLANRPPMGWNSYNCYGAAITEEEVKANAKYMAEKLKDKGWEYIVVDYCWSYPHPPGSIQNNPPQFRLKDNAPVPWLAMDEFGRLLPDPRKFPSAANGNGFKELADYVHSLGLKFGIHVMRGIPRQAVWAKSPIKGAEGVDASMIADTSSICPWLNQMYGVDMNKKGAQAYYNSLLELYSEWGVDFIKMDDIDLKENYPYRGEEAYAFRKAIDQIERPMVLSLSLNMKLENKDHVRACGDMWRISKDFWDDWKLLKQQFELAEQWATVSGPNSWPDADMLQLGWISRRGPHGPERESNFTKDEQRTHMSFWAIMRSPLMMGGDMPDNSPFVESLMTNEEVIALNQQGIMSKQLYRKDDLVVWVSRMPETGNYNVGFFNLSDKTQDMTISWKELGIKSNCTIRNLWSQTDIGSFSQSFTIKVNAHGSELFTFSPKSKADRKIPDKNI
ncbi:glycoside hydrolase family 27 protein [Limibacter armeniacum]|uniref:glycoside hydrolase family 27 protein n=1 Tax=Limibacter armeniacum TaxID=466084 RepID=UPI002FE6B15B